MLEDFKNRPVIETGTRDLLAKAEALISIMIDKKVSEFEGEGLSIKLHPTAFLPKPKPTEGHGKEEIPKPNPLQTELSQLGLDQDQLSTLLNGGLHIG